MSLAYSMWPVVVTVCNLPLWLCMKPEYLMLSLFIPGPKALGKDIDIFLRPLVDELKELWADRIDTRDAGTNNRSVFRMRTSLLWTINNFPMRNSLSGWSDQEYMACIMCNEETPSVCVIAFFDIMIYLVMHLLKEAILGSLVHMRWMYQFKRYLKKLKDCITNQACPDGSIAEWYVVDEALTFCSRYFEDASEPHVQLTR
ncbi:Reverse transcriptase domain-containing protein [Abeliophyllum distichum]|uniref:Reverse transcriptase domain-containing protein n=1 Tax=Abeliophyllum distichum TaxID=126358 RepID=A0ABD1ULU0_9LAMI